jgi:hypothetical protein
MPILTTTRLILLCLVAACICGRSGAATAADQAEQLRIIAVMSEQMRDRIETLPVLLAEGHPLGAVKETTLKLNQNALVVEGQRFDGVVVVAPTEKASFAWAFAHPSNLSSWYILRAQGDMKGFTNFVDRPRSALPGASAMQPVSGEKITLQKLDSGSWTAGERYILWFRFKDETPAEFTVRAGFFAGTSLNGNRLLALLFPAAG